MPHAAVIAAVDAFTLQYRAVRVFGVLQSIVLSSKVRRLRFVAPKAAVYHV